MWFSGSSGKGERATALMVSCLIASSHDAAPHFPSGTSGTGGTRRRACWSAWDRWYLGGYQQAAGQVLVPPCTLVSTVRFQDVPLRVPLVPPVPCREGRLLWLR